MKVAITGSSGLIGSALRSSLAADGHDVVRVVRSGPPPGAVLWDPTGGTIDAAGLEGVDAVVHLAGESIGNRRWNAERKRRIRESRVKGTDLLARTLADLERPPRVLVSGSGAHYYGNERGDEVVDEDTGSGPGFLASVVRDWEAATGPAEDAGIRVAHIRSGVVLDRSDGALARMLPLFRLGLGGRIGSGRQWWSWISLPDHVSAVRHLLGTDLRGPVNLVSPQPATNAELTRTLGRVLRRPTVLPVPMLGPKVLLGSELAEELIGTSLRVYPTRLTGSGFTFAHPDLETALRSVVG